MSEHSQRRRRRRRNPCRAWRQRHLRHPRHAQPGALPALRQGRYPGDHAPPRTRRRLCGRGLCAGQRTARCRGHHQRTRPDQRDDGSRDRLWRIAADAPALVRLAHRHRRPRPRPAARGQKPQRRNGPAGALEPPGAQCRRGGRGGDRGVRHLHRTPSPTGAHRDSDRRAGADLVRRAAGLHAGGSAARRPGPRPPGRGAARRRHPADDHRRWRGGRRAGRGDRAGRGARRARSPPR